MRVLTVGLCPFNKLKFDGFQEGASCKLLQVVNDQGFVLVCGSVAKLRESTVAEAAAHGRQQEMDAGQWGASVILQQGNQRTVGQTKERTTNM